MLGGVLRLRKSRKGFGGGQAGTPGLFRPTEAGSMFLHFNLDQ